MRRGRGEIHSVAGRNISLQRCRQACTLHIPIVCRMSKTDDICESAHFAVDTPNVPTVKSNRIRRDPPAICTFCLDTRVNLCYTVYDLLGERQPPPSITLSAMAADCSAGKVVKRGEIPEWTKGTDCKSVAERFRGSNPLLPTIMNRASTEAALSSKAFSSKQLFFTRPHSSLAEHFFGKEEVLGPIPSGGWTIPTLPIREERRQTGGAGAASPGREALRYGGVLDYYGQGKV
jgi:hypothetical protein